jgi:hypothetical protein
VSDSSTHNRRQRLLVNVAISYVVVSFLLFGIFFFTYRTYFYKLQEQMVLTRARQNENIYLNKTVEMFSSAKSVRDAKKMTHQEALESMAKIRLKDLVSGLKALESQDDSFLESPGEDSPFIEKPEDVKERLSKLLKPVVSLKEVEQPFLEYFNDFQKGSEGVIEFRRFSNGLEQMVNMSYVFVDSVKLDLKAGEHLIHWEIRAYVVPKKIGAHNPEDVVERLLKETSNYFSDRLGIYVYGSKIPLFKGVEHQLDLSKLNYFEKKGFEEGKPFFSSPEPFEVRGVHEGQEVQQKLLNSFYTDPSLKMTFVLHRVINEPEWTQFSFFSRNKLPILLYIILAWVICPLLFWWGIKKSSQLQFKFTVDLDADDLDPIESVLSAPKRAFPSSQSHEAIAGMSEALLEQEQISKSDHDSLEDQGVNSAIVVPTKLDRKKDHKKNKEKKGKSVKSMPSQGTADKPIDESNDGDDKILDSEGDRISHEAEDSSQPQKGSELTETFAEDQFSGPLTRRLMEDGPVPDHRKDHSSEIADEDDPSSEAQIHKLDLRDSPNSDVERIRQNNIRKSSSSYNRHEETSEGQDVDYLAGVQSDVLKSLIKKLRED